MDRDGAFAWKRALLRRTPGTGAVHWGHLYLLVSPVGTRAQLEPTIAPDSREGVTPVEIASFVAENASVHLWAKARVLLEMESLCAALRVELGVGPGPP
ncbi:MAG: hypothetical protein L3K07_00635 [Thermoplasmata archaeon]|nr:hypothetical protein [Thermoplasmata archaeon]